MATMKWVSENGPSGIHGIANTRFLLFLSATTEVSWFSGSNDHSSRVCIQGVEWSGLVFCVCQHCLEHYLPGAVTGTLGEQWTLAL